MEEAAGQCPAEDNHQPEEIKCAPDDELPTRVLAHVEIAPGQRTEEIAKTLLLSAPWGAGVHPSDCSRCNRSLCSVALPFDEALPLCPRQLVRDLHQRCHRGPGTRALRDDRSHFPSGSVFELPRPWRSSPLWRFPASLQSARAYAASCAILLKLAFACRTGVIIEALLSVREAGFSLHAATTFFHFPPGGYGVFIRSSLGFMSRATGP